MNLFGFEAGYDRRVWLNADNTLYVGVMGGYLTSRNIETDKPGRINTGIVNVPSV
jgi:outer membrane autotransporter protein